MVKDPYRYFRIEAQELLEGLSSGLLELEKNPSSEVVRRLLRQAHTLKGASRVVKRADIGDLAHALEDELEPYRQGNGPVNAGVIDKTLVLLDEIRNQVSALAAPDAVAKKPERLDPQRDTETLRVSTSDLDHQIGSAIEANISALGLSSSVEKMRQVGIQLRKWITQPPSNRAVSAMRLRQYCDDLDVLAHSIGSAAEAISTEVKEVYVKASELRLVSAQSLLTDLERATRDAASTLNRDVSLHCSGAPTHIDAQILFGVKAALMHIVRNSVAHGIEPREVRQQKGKPTQGRIDLHIERRGHRVWFRCRDDGRGLDFEAVRQNAVSCGLIDQSSASTMEENALGQLLLRGGVSTVKALTEIAGRGVGLDAARQIIEGLKGEIHITSETGCGTTVSLDVPLSLSSMPVLTVVVDERSVGIPLDNVQLAIRVAQRDILHDIQREHVIVEGNAVPFFSLRQLLGLSQINHPERQSAVVIAAEGHQVALGVDSLGAARSVVVRNIPQHAAVLERVSGVALDEDGMLQLILAPAAVIRWAVNAASLPALKNERQALPLLVIDDSLTTRMLEQSILESAGYEVDLAVSAEDGLEKARRRKYGMFVVDVEMPGMNGFEFVALTQSDPALRATPAILVTSCADPADKLRGKHAGARAYLVKSQFDQAELLKTIRRLVG
ncbi:MAG: response regulator [Myxococcota bacterium]